MFTKTKELISDLQNEVLFYKKTNEELEAQIKSLKKTIEDQKNELLDISKLKSETPSDCKVGEYCKYCSFVKAYTVNQFTYNPYPYVFSPTYVCNTVYYCGKGGICNNFTNRLLENK